MRTCPVCNSPNRKMKIEQYDFTSVVNAGGVAPGLSLFACEGCGMHYVDGANVDQAWFDEYYSTIYRTDDKEFSDQRLNDLALLVRDMRIFDVLDIGGMDGELVTRLHAHGINALPAGVGDEPASEYGAVILSHTLEHIYDVPAMMRRVQKALKPGGLLFVEVPIWFDYNDLTYDAHWQHVNKFTPLGLARLFVDNGFTVAQHHHLPDYREYKVWRIVGKYAAI